MYVLQCAYCNIDRQCNILYIFVGSHLSCIDYLQYRMGLTSSCMQTAAVADMAHVGNNFKKTRKDKSNKISIPFTKENTKDKHTTPEGPQHISAIAAATDQCGYYLSSTSSDTRCQKYPTSRDDIRPVCGFPSKLNNVNRHAKSMHVSDTYKTTIPSDLTPTTFHQPGMDDSLGSVEDSQSMNQATKVSEIYTALYCV